ncbi:MAG: type II toxin-antitoxin system PemK/MazF family toxin [Terriglobales bacterium]
MRAVTSSGILRYPRRGDIHLVELDKPRPALILSVDQLNRHALDVCVVPITTKERARFIMRVFIAAGEGGLSHNSWAKCDQVMTLEKNLVRYPATGALAPATLQKIEEQIRICLGLVR